MSLYGSLGQYFSQTGGTNSPGKAGGAGYNSDAVSNASGGGDSASIAPKSGSGGLFSAAVGLSSSDKSAFWTSFSQQFGGIQNNQVINSPGAIGASPSVSSPTAPISAAAATSTPVLMLIIVAVVAALIVKRI
jgi:hypothetical protein